MTDSGHLVELLDRALKGDEDAWRELLREATNAVYGVASRILANVPDADAEDAVVHVLCQLLDGKFSQGSMIAWMIVVARRWCLTQIRRNQKRGPSLDAIGWDVPEKTDEAWWDEERLESCLGRLSPEEREFVKAYFYDGGSLRSLPGLSLGEARGRLVRVVRQLKGCMAPEEALD